MPCIATASGGSCGKFTGCMSRSSSPGHDLVVVVRSRAIGAPYGKLEEAYLALAAQLGLLREDV